MKDDEDKKIFISMGVGLSIFMVLWMLFLFSPYTLLVIINIMMFLVVVGTVTAVFALITYLILYGEPK